MLAFVPCAVGMKSDDVAWSSARQVCEHAERVLVKRPLFRNRLIAASEEWRIHGPPAHNQIHEQPQRRLIEEPAAHGKEQLLAPFRLTKEHSRDSIHIEE